MGATSRDLRHALRALLRTPGFTSTAVLTLALGIGTNVAIFSFLDQVLLRRLAVADPDRLVVLHATITAPGRSSSDTNESVFSYPMYRDLRDRNEVFDGLIARGGAAVSLLHGNRSEEISADMVSGNFFQVLGVRAAAGRLFAPEDDVTPGGHPLVVLSHGYWLRRFGGDPALVDQKVVVNGQPMTVIGVSEAGFRGLVSGQTPDLYVPIAMKRQITPTWDRLEDRWTSWLNLFGRIRPGLSREQAEAGLAAVYRPILVEQWNTGSPPRGRSFEKEYLEHRVLLRTASQGINQLRSDWEKSLVVLMVMVGVVLLIACANVASLLLVRSASRRKETAVRLALGAGPLAVARQVFAESLLLALSGGLVGVLFASWTGAALLRILPEGSTGEWVSSSLDARLLGFAFLVTLVTCALFGALPALKAGRLDLFSTLKEAWVRQLSSAGHARLRKGMVVAQVAMSVVLLGVAGLFARSLLNLARFDPGFRTESMVTFSVNPRLTGHPFEGTVALLGDLQSRLAALPGVEAVGAGWIGLLANSHRSGNVSVEGYPAREDENTDCQFNSVSRDYFRTLGIGLLAGREFTETDSTSAPKVAIVNETFAKHFLAGRDPVGARMMMGASNKPVFDLEIVGVVKDSRHGGIREAVERFVYLPIAQTPEIGRTNFYLRTPADPAALGPAIRSRVAELDPALPVVDLKTMRVQVDESITLDRLLAALATAFGLLAALLAGLGVYGVIAFMVAQRTGEIGIRLALGATRLDVVRLVVNEVAGMAGLGMAIGLAATLALGRFVESQLFGLGGRDAVTLGGSALLMVVVALAACAIPARRATRVEPMTALRCE